jgi:DNA-binding NarL/FixJ family response regulator
VYDDILAVAVPGQHRSHAKYGGTHGCTRREVFTGGSAVIAQADPPRSGLDVLHDALVAEHAWRAGDAPAAVEAADRALAAGIDPEGRAAAVAAAGAGADGALLDAAARWRGIAATCDGATAARARARAALAAGLAGDVAAAVSDLAQAHRQLPDPAPRSLTVLLGGAGAVIEAVGGALDRASRHLGGLAAVTVPADPMAAERWNELAVTVTAAGGDLDAARAVLRGAAGRGPEPVRPRARLLGAWLDLRAGHLADARTGIATAAASPVLRRDALLAAAVAVGLARRSGDPHAVATTWHRVAPVLAGVDVEPLLLDVWGELSVAAEQVSPADRDVVVDAMRAAVVRAGAPWWAVGAEQWWRLERAVAAATAGPAGTAGAAVTAADAADRLTALAVAHPRLQDRAQAAVAWAAVLAGRVCTATVSAAAARLAAAGLRVEAAALCRAAAEHTTDPAAARRLLGAGRGMRTASGAPGRAAPGGLSGREREVGALVVDGLTHKEIGARLYISPKTVEQHVARLRQKLAASNRATLVAALRPHLDG